MGNTLPRPRNRWGRTNSEGHGQIERIGKGMIRKRRGRALKRKMIMISSSRGGGGGGNLDGNERRKRQQQNIVNDERGESQ